MPPPTDADLRTRAKELQQRGDFEGAARLLEDGIEAAGRDLADLYGMLGGARKKQGDLVAAAQAYDAGFHLEARCHATSTYNALNRILVRVLLVPAALRADEPLPKQKALEPVDLAAELSRIETELRRQVDGPRRGDYWAAGDLAVTAALNGHLAAATEAIERFASCVPPAGVYETYLVTLAALAEVDTPARQTLIRVKTLLAAKGQERSG